MLLPTTDLPGSSGLAEYAVPGHHYGKGMPLLD
jgi:hypothetical protein